MLLCYFVLFHLILGEPPILVCSRFGHHGGCCSLQVRQLVFLSCHPLFSGVFFLHRRFFLSSQEFILFFQEMEKGGGGQGYCGVQVLVHFILDFQIFWTSWLTGRMFWNWLTVINHYIIFLKKKKQNEAVGSSRLCTVCHMPGKPKTCQFICQVQTCHKHLHLHKLHKHLDLQTQTFVGMSLFKTCLANKSAGGGEGPALGTLSACLYLQVCLVYLYFDKGVSGSM